MKPNFIVTVLVYGLKILGLAPFSYQIITLRKNSGTNCTVRGFRFSKIGMAYNIILLILVQLTLVLGWPRLSLVRGSVLSSATEFIPIAEFVLTFFAMSVIIISSTFRHGKTVTMMNRLVQVDCLLSDVENQPVFNKITYGAFSMHLIFNLVLWICRHAIDRLVSNGIPDLIIDFMGDILIYSFIIEYSLVLRLLSREFYRANRNLLRVKELPNHSYSGPFYNDLLPVVKFPTKNHLDDAKLLLEIRTTLYELSRDVAEFFSFPILITITSNFCRIISKFFSVTRCLIPPHMSCTKLVVYHQSLLLIIFTFPIVLLSLRVKNVVKEAKLTGSIIHKLLAAPTMREMKVELRWFSLQLLHERVSFTGYELFTLDPTILHSILDATILYFIMIIQAE